MIEQRRKSSRSERSLTMIRWCHPVYAVAILLLVGSLSGGTTALAADDQPVELTPPVTSVLDHQGAEAKQCTWACLKWTKLCNVDPRGQYKCRRTCANFGEVCE